MRRKLTFFAVEKKKVNVRAVIQFTSAQFPKCKNGKIRLGRAVSLAKCGIPVFEHPADADLCDVRKFAGGLFQRGDSGKFAQRHARHLPALPKPQSRELRTVLGSSRQSMQLGARFRRTAGG